jgi:hypothetical protein
MQVTKSQVSNDIQPCTIKTLNFLNYIYKEEIPHGFNEGMCIRVSVPCRRRQYSSELLQLGTSKESKMMNLTGEHAVTTCGNKRS